MYIPPWLSLVRLRRRIHHRQGLRTGAPPSDQGDVRAAVPSAGPRPVRLRRGSGGHRRGAAEDPLLRHRSAPAPSPSSSPITCSRTGSGVPERATTRARWRGWWAICGATSSCPSRPSRALRRSMPTWSGAAWSGWTPGSGGHTETIGQRMERDLEAPAGIASGGL